MAFDYTVDGEPQETNQHELTPRQILTDAGLDPTQRYLIQIEGTHQESFKERMDETLHMHEKMTFITASLGGTGVS
ncbi:MAG: hypothetical protein E6J28_13535 [Chloroflexi bacterium]|nr:MAG: hypothetical protein E6J28_13535 [Chloroflexota bacterium]